MRENPGMSALEEHVGRVLVVLRVLDRKADLREARRPLEQLAIRVSSRSAPGVKAS